MSLEECADDCWSVILPFLHLHERVQASWTCRHINKVVTRRWKQTEWEHLVVRFLNRRKCLITAISMVFGDDADTTELEHYVYAVVRAVVAHPRQHHMWDYMAIQMFASTRWSGVRTSPMWWPVRDYPGNMEHEGYVVPRSWIQKVSLMYDPGHVCKLSWQIELNWWGRLNKLWRGCVHIASRFMGGLVLWLMHQILTQTILVYS